MRHQIRLENIEELRRREGIEDVELSGQIRGLSVGDLVRLTFLTGLKSPAAETLPVRITSIRGAAFRGKLAAPPASNGLAELRVGSLLTFTAGHIHSVAKERSGPIGSGRTRPV